LGRLRSAATTATATTPGTDATRFATVVAKPLDNIFTDLGDRIEKRRRTFTSWFTDKEFTDLAGFATKLRTQGDPVSKYVYQHLSQKTQQLLTGTADSNLGRALSDDLNVLLERELAARKRIADKEAEKAAVDQAIADGEASSRQREKRRRRSSGDAARSPASRASAVSATRAAGGSCVVLVEGELGIGKTRLCEEFLRRVERESNARISVLA
jgi:transcriptional regulator of acetoin/glycerol metabolism